MHAVGIRGFFCMLLLAIGCSPWVVLAAAERHHPALAQLLAKAEANGSVRVLAGFDEAFQPDGRISKQRQQAQRWRIRQAQQDIRKPLRHYDDAVLFSSIPFVSLVVTADELRALAEDPRILSIQPNRKKKKQLGDSVPLTGASTLHAIGNLGSDWAVAVIDDGVHVDHWFFNQSRIIAQACIALEPASFCRSTSEATPPMPAFGEEADNHGTHVAGIIMGSNGWSSGWDAETFESVFGFRPASEPSGMAPGANLIAIRSDLEDTSIILAIEHIADMHDQGVKIAAVNMSFGAENPEYDNARDCDRDQAAVKAAIDNLVSRNIAVVAAAGNEFSRNLIVEPACLSNVIAIGGTTSGNLIADYSNHNALVDLLAPGGAGNIDEQGTIFSSIYWFDPFNQKYVYTWEGWEGTSMSTPHVAGAFALLRAAVPDASSSQILAALKATGKPLSLDNRGITLLEKPLIQIDKALTYLLSNDTPGPEPIQDDSNGGDDDGSIEPPLGDNDGNKKSSGSAGSWWFALLMVLFLRKPSTVHAPLSRSRSVLGPMEAGTKIPSLHGRLVSPLRSPLISV